MALTTSPRTLEPVAPMLARLVRAMPAGEHFFFEPKWDGFRCIAARAGDDVALWSRNGRPLARYFPEVVDAVLTMPSAEFVVDGELLMAADDGSADFAALMRRLHPAASRVERLARETPAQYLLFDVLGVDGQDLRSEPFAARRARLEQLAAAAGGAVALSPSTNDRTLAQQWLEEPSTTGIDGIVAKDARAPYEPGRRSMLKIKRERTADCVVAGLRLALDEPVVASLLLGLYEPGDVLVHFGIVASFTKQQRREMVEELAPLAVDLPGHPWRDGYALEGGPTGRLRGSAGRWSPEMGLDWVPLLPARVAEVVFTQLDGSRLRHPAQFKRWRPDRDPLSCTTDQLREQ